MPETEYSDGRPLKAERHLAADEQSFSGRRIESLDILRGFAIISIVVMHRLHYNWSAAGPGRNIEEGAAQWVLLILFYLITMAGIFALITGTVNTFKAYQRKDRGTSGSRLLLYGGLSAGLWILALHYVQRIFFANGFTEGRFPIGTVLGWMRTGEAIPLSPALYTESNALSMIGSVVILLTLVLYIVLRKYNPLNLRKHIRMYLILGTIILLATPLVRYQLGLFKSTLIQDHRYFGITLLNLLIGGYGMFPFLAYGFYGAAIGAAVAGGLPGRLIKRALLISGLGFFILGGAGFFVLGGWDFNNLFANTPANQLHWILFRMNQLGFFLLLYLFLFWAVDYGTSARRERFLRFFYPARIFGMVSLTVFFLEPVVAEMLKKIWDLIAPGWNESLAASFLFGIFCLITWWYLLKAWWYAIRFAGSLEWMSSVVIQWLSGKKSSRALFSVMQNPFAKNPTLRR